MATVTDQELITQTVLDYYEGWFDGDAVRMERALHKDLVKRQAGEDLGMMTKPRMVELTERGEGKADAVDRRVDIEVEDISKGMASVTVRTTPYYEYLHLVETGEGWRIANVLFRIP
jgi:hypothetical protein